MKRPVLFTAAGFLLAFCAAPALAQSSATAPTLDARGLPTHNAELGLPYEPEGAGQTDHDAIRRRVLDVLAQQFGTFRDRTASMAQEIDAWCAASGAAPAPQAVSEAYRAAYLAWAPLDSYQFGPIEARGAALTVNFWPDKKGFVKRGLAMLHGLPAETRADPAEIAHLSAAIQGFPAIERLLLESTPDCPSLTGISGNLTRIAAELYDDWFAPEGWADLARSAGPDNPVYLSAEEFTKQIYTALDFGLIRIAEARLSRPLGEPTRSYPRRAEAWRSELSLALIDAQLTGIGQMIEFGLAGDIIEPSRNWVLRVVDQAHERIGRIGMPLHEAVKAPQTRIRAEAVQTKIRYLQLQLAQDIGPGLGVDTGFSAADGD
ncbi:MAG: imelysin family protein [Neomegalonema sp.]|nr:imelysin family protein [Neomegalonema sp.]